MRHPPLAQVVRQFVVAVHTELEYPDGQRTKGTWTGFIVDWDGRWLLITTGHMARDMQKAQKERGAKIVRLGIIEFLSPTMPVPQVIWLQLQHIGGHIYQEGMDMGYVFLPYLAVENLKACGIKPIPRSNIAQHHDTYDDHCICGVIEEGITMGKTQVGPGQILESMFLAPVLAQLKFDGFDVTETAKRLTFHIDLDPLEYDGKPIESIVGMSGAPVCGLRENADGTGGLYLVGIQSRWIKSQRKLFVCPAYPLIQTAVETGDMN